MTRSSYFDADTSVGADASANTTRIATILAASVGILSLFSPLSVVAQEPSSSEPSAETVVEPSPTEAETSPDGPPPEDVEADAGEDSEDDEVSEDPDASEDSAPEQDVEPEGDLDAANPADADQAPDSVEAEGAGEEVFVDGDDGDGDGNPDQISETDDETEEVGSLEDEDSDGEVVDGGEVKTSAKRVDGVMKGRAKRVERIDPEELQRRGVTNLAEALEASSAGAQVSPTGNTRGLILDGLPASQVTVLRDGLPVAAAAGSPQGPIVDLGAIAIAPEAIERIDVYRGVGPVGSGGAGGVVIDIISRQTPANSSISASGQWAGGVNERLGEDGGGLLNQRYVLSGVGAFGPRLGMQASGQYADRAALDVNRDGDTDQAALELFSGEFGLTFRPRKRSLLRVQVLGNSSSSELTGGEDAVFDDLVTRRTFRARLKGRWWAGEDVRLDHHTDVGRDAHDFNKRVRSSGIERLKSDTDLDSITQSFAVTWFTASHDLAVETTGRLWSVERVGETGDLPQVVDARGGVGVADTWYGGRGFEVFSRVFAKGSTDVGGAVDAQVAVAQKWREWLTWRASLARTQRTPTPEELYLFFDHSEVGYQVTGNPNLQPEQLYSARGGVVLTTASKHFGFEVSGFYNQIEDLITTLPDETDSALFTYSNIGRARTAGGQARIQATELPGGFAMLANYTYMPLYISIDDGSRLPNRSTHSGRAEVRRGFWDRRIETWVDVTTRSQMATPEGTPDAPAFALLGAGAMFRARDRVSVMLDVNNILDQTNATWGPMPGFNAMLSLRLGHEFGR